ncbi:MAG: FRG domain-containing protein [Bacteroidales bacterium]|nr:FRG domain-containing protein [Bacteroidales bacterium]
MKTTEEYIKSEKIFICSGIPPGICFSEDTAINRWSHCSPRYSGIKRFNEKDILHDFEQYAPVHAIHYDFMAEREKVLADMQQYGIPTRLLDWTFAPLNALFFACSSNEDKDGEIIVFNPWKYNQFVIGDEEKPEAHHIHVLCRALLSGGWNPEEAIDFVREKYNFKNFDADGLRYPFAFIANYTNNRIFHQRGCYTIQGTSNIPLDEVSIAGECLLRIEVSQHYKKSILKELNQLYINHYSIFPDFEGMKNMILQNRGLFNAE